MQNHTIPEILTFVDLETTGTSPAYDRVIDVGIVRVENGKIVHEYSQLVNPEGPIPDFISSMTGIYNEQLVNSPTFSSISNDVWELLEGSIFVAHNARFDYGFLKQEFLRIGKTLKSEVLCTARLSRKLYPNHMRHNLDSIIERFGFKVESRHRAYPDARVLWDFFQKMQSDYDSEVISETIKSITKTNTIPANLAKSDLDNLPETAGVYLMYGENNTLLYVGKSTNIKSRVRSHFTNDYQTSTDLKLIKEVTKIDYIETAGEMGALLRESTLIKKLSPIYNRALRHGRHMVVLLKTENEGGYFTVLTKESHMIDFDQTDKIIGVFRNKKQVTERLLMLAKEFKLCPKLLGQEKTKGSCFYTQIGRCNGACTENEKPLAYNMRFSQAFANIRIPSWPFDGEKIITEQKNGKTEQHKIYKWCYLGSRNSELDEFEKSEDIIFDWDIYRIIRKFL